MPSWFSKAFKSEPESAHTDGATDTDTSAQTTVADQEDELLAPREVVYAPVLMDDESVSAFTEEVRIKARIDEMNRACTFMVDRPILDGFSCWAPDRPTANGTSPLAAAIFDLGGIGTVLLHNMTVTVSAEDYSDTPWAEFAKSIGSQIREHLKSGFPIVDPEFLEKMPAENEIRQRLQTVLDEELNPAIASHSGVITLDRIEGNTAYITMGGGCQGCAASTITLRQGVHTSFRKAVPEVGAILDETDHAAGKNPFFKDLPQGME